MLPTAFFLLACTSTKLDTSDSAGIDAEAQVEIILLNTVSWLLDM